MKPKLSPIERQAFELFCIGADSSKVVLMEMWRTFAVDHRPWLLLARRVRRQVKKAYENGADDALKRHNQSYDTQYI